MGGNREVLVEGLENAKVVELDYLGQIEVFIVADKSDLPQGLSENLVVITEPISRNYFYGWHLEDYGVVERYRMIQFHAFKDVKVVAERDTTAARVITRMTRNSNNLRARMDRVEKKVKELFE